MNENKLTIDKLQIQNSSIIKESETKENELNRIKERINILEYENNNLKDINISNNSKINELTNKVNELNKIIGEYEKIISDYENVY